MFLVGVTMLNDAFMNNEMHIKWSFKLNRDMLTFEFIGIFLN